MASVHSVFNHNNVRMCTMPYRRLSTNQSCATATKLVTRAGAPLPPQYKGVKPVADRVCIKIAEVEEKSVGGILLPSSVAANKPTQGKVIAVGPGKSGEKAVKMSVKVGDSVTYSKYAGTEFAIEGVDHLLLKEEDCIGTMTGSDVSTMTPLGDRVLIKCTEAEEETAGGLLLTGSKEKPLTGEVVAVGPGKDEEAMGVVVGNSVIYSKYSGSEYEGADGTQYIVIRESDVLAVLA